MWKDVGLKVQKVGMVGMVEKIEGKLWTWSKDGNITWAIGQSRKIWLKKIFLSFFLTTLHGGIVVSHGGLMSMGMGIHAFGKLHGHGHMAWGWVHMGY
jgi:hypothetical protein